MNLILTISIAMLPFAAATAQTQDTLQSVEIDSTEELHVCDSLDICLEDSGPAYKDSVAIELVESHEVVAQADSSANMQVGNTDDIPVPTSGVEPFSGGVGLMFSLERGFVGSLWHTKMKVLYDDDHFYITLILSDPAFYFEVYPGEDIHFKLENGEIISLSLSKDYKVWNYKEENQYHGNNLATPTVYFTQMIYDVPDSCMDKLLSSDIVKVRYFSRRAPRDIDMIEQGNVRKFNREFRESAQQAKSNYNVKTSTTDDQLKGF